MSSFQKIFMIVTAYTNDTIKKAFGKQISTEDRRIVLAQDPARPSAPRDFLLRQMKVWAEKQELKVERELETLFGAIEIPEFTWSLSDEEWASLTRVFAKAAGTLTGKDVELSEQEEVAYSALAGIE